MPLKHLSDSWENGCGGNGDGRPVYLPGEKATAVVTHADGLVRTHCILPRAAGRASCSSPQCEDEDWRQRGQAAPRTQSWGRAGSKSA